MQIEVYPTDAEACEAAAATIAEALRAGKGSLRAAVSGARSCRATVVALAARSDVPWERIEWVLADERCAGTADGSSHAKALRDGLFVPRGIAAARQHVPGTMDAEPEVVARAYGATLATILGADGRLDVVILGIDPMGRLGVLEGASSDDGPLVVVPAPAPGEPARISIAPRLVAAARRVIVTAVGRESADAVAAALREGRGGAALALPSERVTWFVDREAAGALMADARPVDGVPG